MNRLQGKSQGFFSLQSQPADNHVEIAAVLREIQVDQG